MRTAEPQSRPDVPRVNRRTLAAGAMWAVPTVIAARPLPAFAASSPCTGCYTLDWNQAPMGTETDNTYFNLTPVSGNCSGLRVKVNIVELASVSYDARNGQVHYQASPTATVPGMSTANMGIVLYQGGSASRTDVIFTFQDGAGQPFLVDSLSFRVYDLTATSPTATGGTHYRDRIGFSQPTTLTAYNFVNSITGTGTLTDPYTRACTCPSTGNQNMWVDISSNPATGFSSFTTRYTNATLSWQYVGIGDLTVCV